MWRQTVAQEHNARIFRDELDSFLPKKILDFHVHVFCDGVAPKAKSYVCGGHAISKYDFEDLSQDLENVFPNHQTSAVCFGMPVVGFDRSLNNTDIGTRCDRSRFFPLWLFDPTEDTPEILHARLGKNWFLGLKPYPDYVRKSNINAVEIPEMLPDWAMRIVDELGLLVMLHIPRAARLADSLNQEQIVRLASAYPRAKIVLAHVGRAYYLKNVVGNLDSVAALPNVYFDLAMVNNWEVMEYLFSRVDHRKILYGSDMPIALAPGKSVEINDQYTYVTPVPWSLSISDDHKKLVFTSFLYEEIRAVKKAVTRLNLDDDFVGRLFYDNGMSLLRSVMS